MHESITVSSDAVLAIDIGATSIKVARVNGDGHLAEAVRRVATPYPCSPRRLVELIAEEISCSGCARVGVGFPGELDDGRVVEPGNLSRPGGFTSTIDEALHGEWLDHDLQGALREASHQDVRVVNDATLAALGCARGTGRELVFTLGTGLGIALVRDGTLVRIRDVGAEVFRDGLTYDRAFGEHARSHDESTWNLRLCEAVGRFVTEFDADVAHLGGGNSRRVELALYSSLGVDVIVNDNDATLRGVVKLFS